MKEIKAIIRMDKMNRTKEALAEAGFSYFTASKVMGRGKGQVDFRVLMGAAEGREEAIAQLGSTPRLIPKRLLTIVVSDDRVPDLVDALIKANQTGKPGDGKIFVMPCVDAVRVRTGETGEVAIDEITTARR
ncbi:MAG: P-II family nitrogen regulator [Armatimonadota bacterium]